MDLSSLEREALTLLRLNPRSMKTFAEQFGSAELRAAVDEIRQSLLDKKLVSEIGVLDFISLTPAGVREQKLNAIQRRVEAIAGFAVQHRPNDGLTGRSTLAELDKDGKTWVYWDTNSPYSKAALDFIECAPDDHKFLLAELAASDAAYTQLEGKVAEIIELCTTSLAHPEAHQGDYTYVAYRPYEEVLGILNTPIETKS